MAEKMTEKRALERIDSIVSSWENGTRMSTDAINDVWRVLQELAAAKAAAKAAKGRG